MSKKKVDGLNVLRLFVYALLAASAVLFIFSLVSGAKNVRDIALNSLRISANTNGQDAQCTNGESLYGIHNYPYSSVPTEKDAYEKYTNKMPGGSFRCSNICGPSDTTKFATEVLPKITVGGERINIVANKAEFDAIVEKSSGKNQLLDRTVILDGSLARKGLGCFGPSQDYPDIKGATVAGINTTRADQDRAEAARQKKAEEAKTF